MNASGTAPEVGIPLGFLIGAVTGGVAVLLFRTAWQATDAAGVLKVIAELLAIPAFWFGGPWLTTSLLESVEPDEIRASYLMTLAAVFVALAAMPLIRLSWATGLAIGARPSAPAPPGVGDA